MAQSLISVVQGDKNYDLNFTLTDAQAVVVNLTGATLTFKMQLVSDFTVNTSGAMVIVSAVAGTCKYTVQSTDFPVAGTYNCQIQASFSSGSEIITFPDISVIVEASVPQS